MLLLLATVVLVTTLVCEAVARNNWLPYWISRKILHVVAVSSCAIAALEIDYDLLIPIVAVAEILLLYLVATGKVMRDETGRPAWGIVWFPLAFLVLLWRFEAQTVAFGMSVLAICDPAATVGGKLIGWRPYNLTGDGKSWAGSLSFLFLFMILAFWWLTPLDDFPYSGATSWGTVLVVGILLGTAEAIGSRGTDNISVPLLAAWYYFLLRFSSPDFLTAVLLLVLCIVFVVITVRRHSLTYGGAITASSLGYFVVISVGAAWLLPLLVFFISSSVIGRLFPASVGAGDRKHRAARDATQVMANGAVYAMAIFYCFRGHIDYGHLGWEWQILLLIAAAVATADTWASELGQYFRHTTFDILRFRPVPVGLSGGISWSGSLAGLAGAATIASLGYFLLIEYSWSRFLTITGWGFGGMLLDSVLGSALQAKYAGEDGLRDTPAAPTAPYVRGKKWMTNDLVNFLAILITVVVYYYYALLVGW